MLDNYIKLFRKVGENICTIEPSHLNQPKLPKEKKNAIDLVKILISHYRSPKIGKVKPIT